jgi:membrane protease YdiL (CAAX protease family)
MNRTVSPIDRLRAVGVAIGVGILGILVSGVLAVGTVLVLLFAGFEVGPLSRIVISLVVGTGIGFGGVALGYLRYRSMGIEYIGFDIGIPSLRSGIVVVAGLILAFVGVAIGSWLVSVIDMILMGTEVQPAQNAVTRIARDNPAVLLVLIPASYLLIGPGEELLFRGVVQGRIREAFGPAAGVILASAVFAAIHFTALTGGSGVVGRLATIVVLFLPSLVFGTAYELTDNLVVPILIHGTYNAIQFVGLYVVLTRGMMPALL